MPGVYLRNRMRATSAWALETLARRVTPEYELRPRWHTASVLWDPPHSSHAIEHPDLPGLWLLRRAVPPERVEALRKLVGSTMLPAQPPT